jgi:hypothetical protein
MSAATAGSVCLSENDCSSAHRRRAPHQACFLHGAPGLYGVVAKHPPLSYWDGLAWRDPVEGSDLDPLGVDRGHGGFEVTELLLLLAVKPALTTGLLWRFVVAAGLVGLRWRLASGEHSR